MRTPEDIVSVLAISPTAEDNVSLQHIFSHSNWRLECVDTLREALASLNQNVASVVISAAILPDADWRKVLEALRNFPKQPPLIVAAQAADDTLWQQVLDSGGYDVLAKPFVAGEVIRVVSLAWRQWRQCGTAKG